MKRKKSFKLRGLFTLMVSALALSLSAQNITVKGVVTDDTDMTVIGATVIVEGNPQQGTVTDIDGNYVLSNVPSDASLVFSYVGYKTQTIAVNGRTTINVVMSSDTELLDEIVVVGYGTQKKVNLTGAVGSASGDVLEDRPITNIGQGLQGVIPNLNVTMPSGAPGQGATFNIRGGTSLNGGSALILVDGVQTDLNLVNPQDVENISVLKDAASAAIYGARGAFGVVLITTKQGSKNSKTQVNYNNNFSWSSPTRLPDMPNSLEWAQAMNNMSINDGQGEFFTPNQLDLIEAHLNDPVNNPGVFVDNTGIMHAAHTKDNPAWGYVGNTNWFKELYKNNALMQQHNASIQGGGENNNFYGSVAYQGQDGLYRTGKDKFDRYNLTFNYNQSIYTLRAMCLIKKMMVWPIHSMKHIVLSQLLCLIFQMEAMLVWKDVDLTKTSPVVWLQLVEIKPM